MSFSRKMPKRFRDRRDRSHKHPVDKFVNSFYQAGLLCHFADRRIIQIIYIQ